MAKPRCLFRVEDSFTIKNRGLVVVPGILPIEDERFKVGDPLLLRRPDGTVARTTIGGLELLCPNPRHDVVIMLKELRKQDVPIGTEVWSTTKDEVIDEV